jgi:hypothetical protein
VPGKPRIDVFQDLVVTSYEHREHRVTVHVTDRSHRPHRVVFELDHQDAADELAAEVARWHLLGRPLTYVRNGVHGALIDERAAFERAYGVDA